VGHHLFDRSDRQRNQITFIVLQDKLLLLAQQKQHIHLLIGTIMTIFSIEMIEELKGAITKE
jgi:hypothetical protein